MDETDAYNVTALQEYLKDDVYDLIEIDAVLYGDVISSGFASEWTYTPSDDWWPTTLTTVQFNNQTWGVPHWLCSYFAFSRTPTVTQASSIDQLTQAVNSLPQPKMRVSLESWDLIATYLVAVAETYGAEQAKIFLENEVVDEYIIAGLKRFLHTCNEYACLRDVEEDYLALFGMGKISSAFGFLESLNTILQNTNNNNNDITVSWAPYGTSKKSLIFTDVFVKSIHCIGPCATAADAFAAFMLQPSTYEYILTSQDIPNKPYRYIMPATKSAWDLPSLKNDYFYSTVRANLDVAMPLPNYGIPQHRIALKEALTNALL
eukprot:TRINITY_DN3885_c0_g1_i1.p1 TRINITY_DN3885_c0_g1~~TRINITY_DN3885_c0_g1_i1.p1  ORF type:complete len:319 (+),score=63.05 TRINITY_DN3885_c0_g1_i1:282-1238(+)